MGVGRNLGIVVGVEFNGGFVILNSKCWFIVEYKELCLMSMNDYFEGWFVVVKVCIC